MIDRAEISRWARLVARAYAEACVPRLLKLDEARLARALEIATADCILLAVPPSDWPAFYVNPAIGRWEPVSRRGTGPRLQSVDYSHGRVTMS